MKKKHLQIKKPLSSIWQHTRCKCSHTTKKKRAANKIDLVVLWAFAVSQLTILRYKNVPVTFQLSYKKLCLNVLRMFKLNVWMFFRRCLTFLFGYNNVIQKKFRTFH